jgi:hypothetical protein
MMGNKYHDLAKALSKARSEIQCGVEINRVQVDLMVATVNNEYMFSFYNLNMAASTKDTGVYLDELRKLHKLATIKASGGIAAPDILGGQHENV